MVAYCLSALMTSLPWPHRVSIGFSYLEGRVSGREGHMQRALPRRLAVAWGLCVLALALRAWGAPAPVPRAPGPVHARDLHGPWLLTWDGGRGRCHLASDGSWSCEWGGDLWVGT